MGGSLLYARWQLALDKEYSNVPHCASPWNEDTGYSRESQKCLFSSNKPLKWEHPHNLDTSEVPEVSRVGKFHCYLNTWGCPSLIDACAYKKTWEQYYMQACSRVDHTHIDVKWSVQIPKNCYIPCASAWMNIIAWLQAVSERVSYMPIKIPGQLHVCHHMVME